MHFIALGKTKTKNKSVTIVEPDDSNNIDNNVRPVTSTADPNDVNVTIVTTTTSDGDITTTEEVFMPTDGAVMTTTDGEFTTTETIVTRTDSSNHVIVATTTSNEEVTIPKSGFGAIAITVDNKNGVAKVLNESGTVEMDGIKTSVETTNSSNLNDDSQL